MELLYLYIPKGAGTIFNDTEINFTGRHRFHYNKEENKLEYRENLDAIDGSFFSIPRNEDSIVSSVSAIVGDNGSGKTTIAEFIYKMRREMKPEHIMIWRTSNENFKISNFIIPGYIRKLCLNDLLECTDFNFEKLYQKESSDFYKLNRNSSYFSQLKQNLSIGKIKTPELFKLQFSNDCPVFKYDFDSIRGYTFIYASNFYNPFHEIETANDIYDISTSNLLRNQDKKIIENGQNIGLDPISAHSQMEMNRNVKLFNKIYRKGKSSIIDLPIPKKLIVSISINDVISYRSEHEQEIRKLVLHERNKNFQSDQELKLRIDRMFEGSSDGKQSNDKLTIEVLAYRAIWPHESLGEKEDGVASENSFFSSLIKSFLANYFRYHLNLFNGYLAIESPVKPALSDFLIQFIKIETDNSSDKKVLVDEYLKLISSIAVIEDSHLNQFRALSELIKILNAKKLTYGNDYEFDVHDSEDLENFINAYFKASTITNFLTFNWSPKTSSGEFAQLNIYSRLNSLLDTTGIHYNNLKNDVVIFLDEIEITIHPRLQRKLLINIIRFINQLFKDAKYKVHLIFATHSPILLSDIPKDHTVLLKRMGEYVTIQKNQKETFSANIHSLYDHHFRMGEGEESLIGQFAFKKIQELVHKINSNEINEGNIGEIEREIAVIGEPFMKHKIKELLEENMPSIYKRRYQLERLNEIEEEAEKLRKQLSRDDNA